MHGSDELRDALARQQAALVRSLINGDDPPPGFDSVRVKAAAHVLARKRTRAVARAWPGLSRSLGGSFTEHFLAYSSKSPAPSKGGAMADGYAFARWLSARKLLPDTGRLGVVSVELRYCRTRAGIVPRRLPALRIAWLKRSRRLLFAVRLPYVGERWFQLG